MKKEFYVLISTIALCFIYTMSASADEQLVSGKLKKLNGLCQIAINQEDGNGLVVWSRGDAKKNDSGNIYGAELIRQADGSYLVGEYFLVSSKKGSHQRPKLVYLEEAGKYLIVWDTAVYDLSVYLDNRPFPLPGAKILARTYTPTGAAGPTGTVGILGDAATISDSIYEFNAIANVFHLEQHGASNTRPIPVPAEVFFTCFASDEEKDGKVGPFIAGMWGGLWLVHADAVAAAGDLQRIDSRLMADWTTEAGMGVTVSGFQSNGTVFAAGAHEYWGGNKIIGRGGIYKISPGALSVDDFFPTGQSKEGKYPLNAHGQVVSLNGAATAPGAEIRMVGLSNVVLDLISVESDFSEGSLEQLGGVSKKAGDVVDQRFFRISRPQGVANPDPALKLSDLYVLYHTKKGDWKYRNLAGDIGTPQGASKKVLKTKKKKMNYLSVATYENDVLVAYSEKANKKKSRIYLYKFSVK